MMTFTRATGWSAPRVVTPAPGQTTSDMQTLYGNASPALPVPIVACAGAPGVTVPKVFLISVTYQHQ